MSYPDLIHAEIKAEAFGTKYWKSEEAGTVTIPQIWVHLAIMVAKSIIEATFQK